MDPKVYAERKAAEVEAYNRAAAELKAVFDGMDITDPRRVPIGEAEAMLREAAIMIAHLGDHLLPYSDPDFYAELKPSRATEDGGQFARDGLEYVFDE